MMFDADIFVPATDTLQFAVRSQGDSYAPVFTTARELLGINYMAMRPEVIYDGFVHIAKLDQAINEIFQRANTGSNVLFPVVDDEGSLVGWQVLVWYNEDDYDDEDYYDDDDEYSGEEE